MYLLTCFTIVTNTVCEAMASRVKFWVLSFLFFFHLLDNLALLLLRELFAIYTSVLSCDWGQTFSVLFFLYSSLLRRCLLLHLRRFNIILGCFEVELNVCLNTANLVIRSTLLDLNSIVTTTILDVNCVPFKEHRVMSQFLLENGLRVRQIDESGLMRLYLHVSSLLKVHVPQNDFRALFNAKIVHHPYRNVAHALFRREL